MMIGFVKVLIGDQYADVSIAEALRQRGGDIRTCLFAVEPTARELVSVQLTLFVLESRLRVGA